MSNPRVGRATFLIVLSVLLLAGCGSSPESQPSGGPVAAKCRDGINSANRDALAQALVVTQAYASTVPELAKLTFTGAIRTGTIIFKGIDDQPVFSGVPKDLRRLTRPLEKSFTRIRRATKEYIQALEALGDAAKACAGAAREADEPCIERAAGDVARSITDVIRLVRRRLGIGGRDLQEIGLEIERMSQRIEQENVDVSNALAALEICFHPN